MAKAKSKAKAKAQKKPSSKLPTLPNGYKVIGRAPKWDVDKNPIIEGERGPTITVEMPPRKKGEKKHSFRTLVVNDETIGAVSVSESSMLRDFFDQTEEGDHVRLEFLGLGTAKKGQQPPKLFSCAIKE